MTCLSSTSKVNNLGINPHVHRQVPSLPLATSLPARCLLLHHQSSQPQGSSHTLSRGKWINILILDDGCCWQQDAVDSSNSPACPSSDLLFSFHQAYLLPRLFVLCWNLRDILNLSPFSFLCPRCCFILRLFPQIPWVQTATTRSPPQVFIHSSC